MIDFSTRQFLGFWGEGYDDDVVQAAPVNPDDLWYEQYTEEIDALEIAEAFTIRDPCDVHTIVRIK